jgi:hypothetical protein
MHAYTKAVAVVTDLVMIAVVAVVVVVTDGTTGAVVVTGAATTGLFAQLLFSFGFLPTWM